MAPRILLICALFTLGCENKGGESLDTGASGEAPTNDTGNPSATDSLADTGSQAAPSYFGINASLFLKGGGFVEGEVTVQVYPEDLTQGPLCEVTRAVETAVDVASPDPSIFHWWEIRLLESAGDTAAPEESCEGAEHLPAPFYLGLGAFHQDLLPAVVADGVDADLAVSLYGAYAGLPGQITCEYTRGNDRACVFGYAGVQDAAGDLDLTRKTQAEGPLADGRYGVTSAYLFPILIAD